MAVRGEHYEITPEVESTLDDVMASWPDEHAVAMRIAYNLGRRHERTRWREHIDRTLGDIIGDASRAKAYDAVPACTCPDGSPLHFDSTPCLEAVTGTPI